jgi:hypothetical protein
MGDVWDERDVIYGHEAEIAVFGVRLPDEPLEPSPMPFLDLLRAERLAAELPDGWKGRADA